MSSVTPESPGFSRGRFPKVSQTDRKFLITRTSDDRYCFAVYSESGFVEYRVWPRTSYYRRKIRKACRDHGVALPGKIAWDSLPKADRIEKVDSSPEAQPMGGAV